MINPRSPEHCLENYKVLDFYAGSGDYRLCVLRPDCLLTPKLGWTLTHLLGHGDDERKDL